MRSLFATPGDDYLRTIGELAYAVSSLEWTLLGDLTLLSPQLPDDVTVSGLAGRTTGAISKCLLSASESATDETVRTYLGTGGRALAEVAEIRNAVLHARPASVDGEQRLHRWRATPPEAYTITDSWLAEKLARIAELSSEVNAVRPPLPGTP